MSAKSSDTPQYAEDFLEFINSSPTRKFRHQSNSSYKLLNKRLAFHAVESAKKRLEAAGYKCIKERDSWASVVIPGGKYYLTRNSSTIVAFAVGKKWIPGQAIGIIGTHVDSCALRLKPVSKRQNDGFIQFGVETYGGGLWHTWFDRDLAIAGRLLCRTENGIEQKLVNLNRPICRIPNLAIHFGDPMPFNFNKETEFVPIAGLIESELRRLNDEHTGNENRSYEPIKRVTERHWPHLVELLAKEAGVEVNCIEDVELKLYDHQRSCLGGLNNEMIFSSRLDNLMMTYCALSSLINSTSENGTSLEDDSTVRLFIGCDNEEHGSQTAQGADSDMLPSVLRRLCTLQFSLQTPSTASYDHMNEFSSFNAAYEQTIARSFVISADMVHSVNPNYSSRYESEHKPHMNEGVVIKINANGRYATLSPSIALIKEIARRAKTSVIDSRKEAAGVPMQLFVVRQDGRCGTTIG